LSPFNFGIYVDKLEECLEDASCVGPTLIGIVIVLLLYVDSIVLLERSSYILGKNPRILEDFFFSIMGITFDTSKTKFMVVKSTNVTNDTLMYNLEEDSPYKYHGMDIHHKLS